MGISARTRRAARVAASGRKPPIGYAKFENPPHHVNCHRRDNRPPGDILRRGARQSAFKGLQPHRGGTRMEPKKTSDFPQELLNLFDGYVHGGISRRQFLNRAQKFAVGGVTAAALFRMLKPNYAWAVQVPADDKRIQAVYDTVPSRQGNGSIKGYLVRPANAGKLPSILVVHENRGLNPY